ncbi:MAG: tetratricopeptide repeat protein [Acidobacteriota bacterium]
MTGEISNVHAGKNVVLAGTYIEAAGTLTSRSPLHQLPAPPADFVGRTEDLTALRASVRKGGATIYGLQGQGGVGKTALALVLAREMSADFPDAQIFLDLQGVSERPLSSADAMAHVVRSFYPDVKLPEGTQLAAVYRDVLTGKRALLLMDNASGHDQVAPLVPPTECALLVTSRQKFTLPGLAVRDLELLPEKDARELLLAIAPQIGHRAGEIARLCGCLPFALRIAAGTLMERPDLSVEAFEKRLGREKERAAIGEKVLGLTYSLLPDAFQERYRQLSVFAGDFDAPAAGAVWELGEDETDETLGAFVRGSLLEGKDGRYKLHDLAQGFAASRLAEEEKAQGELRHAEHYCGVLNEANRHYEQGNEHILVGLALFDRERHQITAGQAWAANNLQTKEEAARLASWYPNAGFHFLLMRLLPGEYIEWLEMGQQGARRAEDRKLEGSHLGNLGVAYRNLSENRRAIEHYSQALAIFREIGDRRGEGGSLGNLGNAYYLLGETRAAIEFFEQHLVIAREIEDRRGEGNALGNLGNAFADLGETRRAIEFYEQQLAIANELGDRRGEGNALGNLGLAYAAMGETQRAINHYKQYLAITREIGDRRGEGNASWNLGLAYEEQGELARAVELMQVCVDFEREIGHVDAEKHSAYVLAIRAGLAG